MNDIPERRPVVLEPATVERLRMPSELAVVRAFAAHPGLDGARTRWFQSVGVRPRRLARATGLPLGETMAPRAHALAREARRMLGVRAGFELYQTAGRDSNAWASTHHQTAIIMLQGPALKQLDAGALLALMGHEFGHFIAHGANSPLVVHPALLGELAHARGRIDADDAARIEAFAARQSQAMELTADRFALLACQDLDAALRLEMTMTTGLPLDELMGWNPRSYATHCAELVDELLATGAYSAGRTHPEHGVRAHALCCFAETEVYCELTGRGRPTRSLRDVNARIERVLPRVQTAARAQGT